MLTKINSENIISKTLNSQSIPPNSTFINITANPFLNKNLGDFPINNLTFPISEALIPAPLSTPITINF